jgi:hypothetical protein
LASTVYIFCMTGCFEVFPLRMALFIFTHCNPYGPGQPYIWANSGFGHACCKHFLSLSWAVPCHKCQGCNFKCRACFVSRCMTLWEWVNDLNKRLLHKEQM